MYLNLLESRLLLNAIGCDVDISDQSADVENWLDARPNCALIIVCHTVLAEERRSIESRCRTQRINTMIYSLENAMEPEEFRSRVSELLNRVCPQPNNRFVKAGRANDPSAASDAGLARHV